MKMTEQELLERSRDPQNIPIVLTKDFAFILVEIIKLALRHPAIHERCENIYDDMVLFICTLERMVDECNIAKAVKAMKEADSELSSVDFDQAWDDFLQHPDYWGSDRN